MAKIEIEGAGVRICVEGMPDEVDDPKLWTDWVLAIGRQWKDAVAIASAARLREIRAEADGGRPGSGTGFTQEPSGDYRNGQLLGDDWVGDKRPGYTT